MPLRCLGYTAGRMVITVPSTTLGQWERALALGTYRADTLAAQGSIHGTSPRQAVCAANRLLHGR